MRRSWLLVLTGLFLLAVSPLMFCGGPGVQGGEPAAAPAEETFPPADWTGPRPRRAVFIVWESYQAEAPDRIELPTISKLMEKGTHFSECIVPLPTRTRKHKRFGTVISNHAIIAGTIFWNEWDGFEFFQEVLDRPTINRCAYPSYGGVGRGFTENSYKKASDNRLLQETLGVMDRHPDWAFTHVHPQDLMNGVTKSGSIWDQGSDYRRLALSGDREIGNFIAGLEERGWLEETLIFILGDHGVTERNTEGDPHPPFEPASWKVPLTIVGPGIKAGARYEYADSVDLVPTACYLMGVRKPRRCAGRVLAEALVGGPGESAPPEARKLLRFNQLGAEFERTGTAAARDRLRPRFWSVHNYMEWGTGVQTLDDIIANNERVLAELRGGGG